MTRIFMTYILIIVFKNSLWLSKSLIIVRHRRISPSMLRTFENADYPDEDPRKLKYWRFRQSICHQVITAREYIGLSQHVNEIPTPTSLSIPTGEELNTINFQRFLKGQGLQQPNYLCEKEVTMDLKSRPGKKLTKIMKLLECVNLPRRNWFVGFNGNDKRMFLIERVKWHPRYKLKWTASIEPKAQYDPTLKGPQAQKRLFQYFKNQIMPSGAKENELILEVPKRMSLCSVKLNDHLRICSIAFEALVHQSARFFPQDVRYLNYVNLGTRRCMNKRIILESGKPSVKIDVLPCSINRDISTPQFFVLADGESQGAVFILRRTKSLSRIKVTDRLENLIVLLESRRNKTAKSETNDT